MERLEKVATPATAATVAVPDSVPLPGLAPMATVTLAVDEVTVLLNGSCTVTWMAGEIAAPAVALVGWTVKASLDADAGLMLKVALVAPVSEPDAAVRVYPLPDLSMDRFEKVATPPTAA